MNVCLFIVVIEYNATGVSKLGYDFLCACASEAEGLQICSISLDRMTSLPPPS